MLALAGAGCGGGSAAPTTEIEVAAASCTEDAYRAQDARGWTHPSKYFYAPGDEDTPTKADLEHLLVNDNAVVVEYRTDLPAADRRELEQWGPSVAALVIVPSELDGAPPIEAYTRFRRLVCDGVDVGQLTAFADGARGGGTVPHP